jgi:hypothetical protein
VFDDRTHEESMDYLRKSGELTRREFGALSAGAGLSILLPMPANAQEVTESEVEVPTPDGAANCFFVHPSSGAHPGVIGLLHGRTDHDAHGCRGPGSDRCRCIVPRWRPRYR